MENREIEAVLKKVALGFSVEEVTEEYGVEDGEIKLVKRRETRKDVPPDLKAVKMLLDEPLDVSAMSDEELERERQRLLKLLKEDGDERKIATERGRTSGKGVD